MLRKEFGIITPDRARKKLEGEGFSGIRVWRDSAGTLYPDHRHPGTHAYLVLDGGMDLTINGKTTTLRQQDRFDVPAGVIHSARMGPRGCWYATGEKR